MPLAVLSQLPLGYALQMAGHGALNAPASVPSELPGAVMPERMSAWQRLVVNPRLKRRRYAEMAAAYAEAMPAARGAVGLPPPQPGAAPLELPACLPRSMVLSSAPPELECERGPLPAGWHATGPQGVDFGAAPFPPPLPSGGDEGARLAGFLEAAEADGVPVVYVALGTLARIDAERVRTMAAALASLAGARVVWSLAKASGAHGGCGVPCCSRSHASPSSPSPPTTHPRRLPPDPQGLHQHLPAGLRDEARVLVTAWAPQQALLAQVAVTLFVTHAGLNSLCEAVCAGLPMLALPHFADQTINAQHIVNRGLGAQLQPATMTAASLARAIEGLLADTAVAERARVAGERARARSGPTNAAALLLAFAAGGQG
jgi:hypothetical protein